MLHACCAGCAMQSIHPHKSHRSAESARSRYQPDGLPSMPPPEAAARAPAWRAAQSRSVVSGIENGSRPSRSSAGGAATC